MNIAVFGAGMMGRAIAFDLSQFSKFDSIIVADANKNALQSLKKILPPKKMQYKQINLENRATVQKIIHDVDIIISAVPYRFNYVLSKMAVEAGTHFLDLGGNNDIVQKERGLSSRAKQKGVTVIPDCGLAPGLVSIITRDIVDKMDTVDYVKLRVGGLPVHPQPPLQYQLVFSPYGLINEYVEDAMVLDHGRTY